MFGESVKTPVSQVSIDKLIRPVKSAIGVRKTPALNNARAPVRQFFCSRLGNITFKRKTFDF